MTDLTEFEDAQTTEDVATALRKVESARTVLRDTRAALRESEAAVQQLSDKLKIYERIDGAKLEPPKWTVRRKACGKHQGIATMLVTDIHWEETVRPEELGGYNAYDRKIAAKRLRRAFEKFIVVAQDNVGGINYDGACIPIGGDVVTGYIHDELRQTNDGTLADTVVEVTEHLEAGVRMVADEFGQVYVPAVPGNHDRWDRKPKAKLRSRDTVTWIIYQFLAKAFQGDDRVTVAPSDSADARFNLYDHRYLLTHGDQFRGGSGISGALSPLMLGQHRKTKRNAALGDPYDTMILGHFHQHLTLPGVIVGNCLKGADEYSYVSNFTPSPASQAFWVSTPEHGPTFMAQIYVQDRKDEGW